MYKLAYAYLLNKTNMKLTNKYTIDSNVTVSRYYILQITL